MRILTFRPSLNRIDIVTYSPYLNQYKTDSNNQFSITWHSTGVANSTGTIAGSVRGQRRTPSPYPCVPISGATLTASGESTTSGQQRIVFSWSSGRQLHLVSGRTGMGSDRRRRRRRVIRATPATQNFFLAAARQCGWQGDRIAPEIPSAAPT